MNCLNNISQLIGNTPLYALERYCAAKKLARPILGKLEYFNVAGSVKDRAALYMINDAEKRGFLTTGSVIIEPTSGNTGIGLACVAATRGYHVILTMPDSMSEERRAFLRAYGAEIVLTPGADGMQGAVDKANALAREYPRSFIPGQFENPANARAHYETTGPEIWNDTDGKVDIFVAGVGTGGTITGVGRFLKGRNKDVKIIAVEPAASPILSGGEAGPHKIQGLGANFVPELLDRYIIDEIITVSDDDACAAARELARMESLLVGISSGAAVFAAMEIAKRYSDKTVVALLPDSGNRYLSTGIYN